MKEEDFEENPEETKGKKTSHIRDPMQEQIGRDKSFKTSMKCDCKASSKSTRSSDVHSFI